MTFNYSKAIALSSSTRLSIKVHDSASQPTVFYISKKIAVPATLRKRSETTERGIQLTKRSPRALLASYYDFVESMLKVEHTWVSARRDG